MVRAKEKVINKYPKAYAARDIYDFWHIWSPGVRGALSGGQQDTKSAAVAWKRAAERMGANDIPSVGAKVSGIM